MDNKTDNANGIDVGKITIENALAISSLTQIVSRTSTDVDKLIKHAEKIDKVMLTNSQLDGRLGSLESQVKSDRKTIDVVYTIMKYPKLAALSVVTAYVLTIQEVRMAIYEHLTPVLSFMKLISG